MNKIYKMKLHEDMNISSTLNVVKVPGGWIYESFSEDNGVYRVSSTFVPMIDNILGEE